MSPSWVTFLFEVANFLLLAGLLGWAFFRPVRDALEQRRARLEREEHEAADKLAEAQRALEQVGAQRREAESSLAALRERVREEAERERERLLDAAREQAQRERETLKTELAAQRRGQAKRIAADAADAAREIVVSLLEQIAGPDLERALAQAAGREVARLAAAGPVAPVIVESASALDPALRDALTRAAGLADADLVTRVDPELVAGVRVLTARGVVDASARGLAAHAERTLLASGDADATGARDG